MKIFISWSGALGQRVGLELRRFLMTIFQRSEIFSASEDIDAGARWQSTVLTELNAATIGIVVVTLESLRSPWLAFEAGAMASRLEAPKVFPILVDLQISRLEGPLLMFQAVRLREPDVKRLIFSLNSLHADPLSDEHVDRLFEAFWPDLDARVRELVGDEPKNYGSGEDDYKKVLRELDARIARLEELRKA